eukprot:6254300-Pyramimonas_sp.AAC.1
MCRAPIRGGRLCSRRDADRCPFHGRIVARDALGQPLEPLPGSNRKYLTTSYEPKERSLIHL